MIDELYTQAVARQKEPKAGSYTNYLLIKVWIKSLKK